jgi:hypothetical protein
MTKQEMEIEIKVLNNKFKALEKSILKNAAFKKGQEVYLKFSQDGTIKMMIIDVRIKTNSFEVEYTLLRRDGLELRFPESGLKKSICKSFFRRLFNL